MTVPRALSGKKVLLIVSGGIAAYKTPDLVRRLKARGAEVRALLTEGGAQLVAPLALQTVTGNRVYKEMWSLIEESDIGHIELSRSADILLVAPATANLLAQMALGLAQDLASTTLLATDKPILAAPAMNVRMWNHPATQANLRTLAERGVRFIGPDEGDMACGEYGPGRMSDPAAIADAVEAFFAEAVAPKPLAGLRALVTSGPTREPIDPVRFIANRSSGKQGHAIAAALARAGAAVTLVSGPVREPDPQGCSVVRVETAREMLAACETALPADIAVFAAAVADWRVKDEAAGKLKKTGGAPPALELVENPDILATIARREVNRPRLVIGFAAETENVVANAVTKRERKGCDWIVANDVAPGTGTFGGDDNTVHLVRAEGVESWPTLGKTAVAERLAAAVAEAFARKDPA
jgi:phosphopantothenoylcysteine decarboxylase / phosphopantothenate---cysteine ligase